MQLQTIIVFAALASASAYPQNAEDVRHSIENFRDATSTAISTGSQKLKTLIAEIEVSLASSEDKSYKKLDELKKSTEEEIVKTEQEGVQNVADCVKIGKADLSTSLDVFKNIVKDCGSNAKSKSNKLLDEVQTASGGDAYNKRQVYYRQLDACIKDNSESCLNDLLAVVKEVTKTFPEEILKRFDQTPISLGQIESDANKCFSNAENEAAEASKKIVTQLNECIKSK